MALVPMGWLSESQSRQKGQCRNMWQKEGKGRKGLSWFIYKCLGQFAWLAVCSCWPLSCVPLGTALPAGVGTDRPPATRFPSRLHDPLRSEVHALFSRHTQVIPYHTKERWHWCPAAVLLTLINPHTLLTLEQHLGKTVVKKGLQEDFLWHQIFFQPPSYVSTSWLDPNSTTKFSKLLNFLLVLGSFVLSQLVLSQKMPGYSSRLA